MSKKFRIKVLVSGASGILGYGILRSLRNSSEDYFLIGTSCYQISVANAFCDLSLSGIPITSDSKFSSVATNTDIFSSPYFLYKLTYRSLSKKSIRNYYDNNCLCSETANESVMPEI